MNKSLRLLLAAMLMVLFGMGQAQNAQWYGYILGSFGGDTWQNRFVSFTTQNPSSVQSVSEAFPQINAATYLDGYVWYVTATRSLCKAPFNEETQTIGASETVVPILDQYRLIIDMSYNPIDGKMYYLCQDSQYNSSLKYSDLATPSVVETVGDFNVRLWTLAINSQGQAYGVAYEGGNLHHVNLTNATTTLVGSTGKEVWYTQSMAFDLDTDVLYWAQLSTANDHGFYQVNTQTGEATSLGEIGGSGVQLSGLFMVPTETPEPEVISEIFIEGFSTPVWGEHPDYDMYVDDDAPYFLSDLVWHWTSGMEDPAVAPEDIFDDEDKAYYLATKFSPKPGYIFANHPRVYYNGDDSLFDIGTSFGYDYWAFSIDFYVTNPDPNGVSEPSHESLSVWPNPACNTLYLEGMEGEEVTIIDVMGYMVLQGCYDGPFDISSLSPGLYAVKVAGHTVRIVKE